MHLLSSSEQSWNATVLVHPLYPSMALLSTIPTSVNAPNHTTPTMVSASNSDLVLPSHELDWLMIVAIVPIHFSMALYLVAHGPGNWDFWVSDGIMCT